MIVDVVKALLQLLAGLSSKVNGIQYHGGVVDSFDNVVRDLQQQLLLRAMIGTETAVVDTSNNRQACNPLEKASPSPLSSSYTCLTPASTSTPSSHLADALRIAILRVELWVAFVATCAVSLSYSQH